MTDPVYEADVDLVSCLWQACPSPGWCLASALPYFDHTWERCSGIWNFRTAAENGQKEYSVFKAQGDGGDFEGVHPVCVLL